VRRQLLELELAGLIKRARRFDGAGHRTSDRYVLPVGQEIPTGQSGQRPNQPEAKSATGQNDHRPNMQSLPANYDSPTGQSGQVSLREPPVEPTAGRTLARLPSNTDALFDKFWSIYPRREGKGAAKAAFARALRGGVTAEKVLEGAARLRDDPNLPDRQFIAHPATWLNQARWDDDPLPSRCRDRPGTALERTESRYQQGRNVAELLRGQGL
jgi:hypothetical protein